jgi:hypothetical protein
MHQAIALVAPRGFLVLDKTASSSGQWLNIPSSHVAALVGAKVYQALGVGGNLHYINTPTTSHCQWQDTYNTHLQDFVQKFLHRTKPANGTTPLFTATAAPDTAKWLDWTTPSLSGDLTIGGCGPAPSGFTLAATASPANGGEVTRNPAPPASGRYEEGTAVTVTAVPKSGWKFDSWEGDATGRNASTTVSMNKNMAVTAKFSPTADGTENLITNGNFANTQNWKLNTWNSTSATFAVSGGNANITAITPASGTNAADHNIQLVQNGISLVKGMNYRLTFEASAASARDISVYIQMDVDPYTQYMSSKTASLSASKQTFTYEFEMKEASDDNSRIAFNFGNAAPNVSISNVKLVYIASASTGNSSSSSDESPSSSSNGISPIASNSHAPIINSQTTIYYSLQGSSLGSAKPSKPGIYIVKEGYLVKKVVVK